MCDPATALQALGSVAKFGAQQSAADEQNKRARENYMNQATQSNIATLQEHTAASDKLFQDSLKAMEARSEYEASAESFGGSLVGRMLRDKKAVDARNKQNIDTNFDNNLQQRQYELEGLRTQANGRMSQGPSPLGLGLEIGSAYLESQP